MNVLKLDDYRDRRRQRLRVARALHGADPGRSLLLGHLDELAHTVGADRVATVWVDEYGPGLVHPHVVLDLLSDHPRRSFASDALRRAWDRGVPGACEAVAATSGVARDLGQAPWSLTVALGSDGTRAWFVVADSVRPRPALDGAARDRAMFLVGECSAVVLHRDLDAAFAAEAPEKTGSSRFAGWSILQDLEGREADSEEGRIISLRFVVGRLPRLLVEDDMTVPLDRLRSQAARAREEIQRRGAELQGAVGESRHWASVLTALEGGSLGALASSVLAWAGSVDDQGHHAGALELYDTAYEIAAAACEVDTAVEAARLSARCLRRQSRWEDAQGRYSRARSVAEAAGMQGRVALVLDGMATIHRERGNLPAARRTLSESMAFAEASGDPVAVARVHHGLMGLEQNAGNLDEAVQEGWRAVRLYTEDRDRTRGLAGLAGVFQDQGHLQAAEDAWTLVAHLSDEGYYRFYAFDALSHIAALRRDAALFARRAAAMDALRWETAAPESVRVEILYYRGLSYAALGRVDEARTWFERAVEFAEAHGFSRTLFAAEKAMSELGTETRRSPDPVPVMSEPTRDVTRELEVMRRERVGAPA